MSAVPQIFSLLAQVMSGVGVVGKSRKNAGQGYQFRGLDDVVAAVQPVLAALGVVVVPRVIDREREEFKTAKGSSMFSVRLLVEHSFFAPDGSSVVCTTLGEAMDSGDKASNKAMSAALKYALTETLMIPTYEADRDTEDSSPEVNGRADQRPPQQQRQAPPNAPTAQDIEAVMAEIALAKTREELNKVLPAAQRIAGNDPNHRLRVAFNKRCQELPLPTQQKQRGAA